MVKKTFYVTTPIYYPSGNLHIGHVYTTTLAWVLRNYKRADGYDAIMLTGADEHGQKIELKAKENNVTPQEYVDRMTLQFKALWHQFALDFDLYSRTTNASHIGAVQKQFTQLLQSKEIFKGYYQGLYSVPDEEFLTKTQATKQGGKYYHPTSGHELHVLKEESYFLKVSKYEAWIKEYYNTKPMFIIPQKTANELLSNFINQGLEDLSISRSSFTWGIKIKEDQTHIMYVWLDALNNYLTALGYLQEVDSNFQKYWVHGDEIVHIVGKEIARFHGIYWPIILKANNLRQPTTILSHGWIITPEGKMSKSKGNVIDPQELITRYGHEPLKYYLASQIKVGQDGMFEKHVFVQTINADLANNVGNLITRTLALAIQNFQAPITHLESNIVEDLNIIEAVKSSFSTYKKLFDEFKIATALKVAIALAKQLNQYIDATRPWALKDNKTRLRQVLNVLLNGIYAVATMLSVVMPQAMKRVQTQLNITNLDFEAVSDFHKFDNVLIQTRDIVFERF